MIKMQIIGNLGKDATTNTVNGKQVINFTVAHTENYKDKEGNKMAKTTWVDCAYWTESKALPDYLKKGQQVFVEGQPEVRTFPKQDGSTGASLTVRVREIQLVGGKSESGAAATTGTAASDEPIDDIPF